MAEVATGGEGGGGRHHKKRAKKLSTRIDMTPMVDLGFLLLTFFMLTTTFSQPKVIGLTPPVKTKQDSTLVKDTLALTVILTKDNRIYYYNGSLKENPDSNNIMTTDYSDNGLRKLVLSRNSNVNNIIQPLDSKHINHQIPDTAYERFKEKAEENKYALFVIIRTDSLTRYVNVINTLDEMNICNVGKYSLVDITDQEKKMMSDYNSKHNIK